MRIMIKGGVWKNTEDEILKAAVMKYGKNQWARISSLLVRKSAKQCKARWYEWLDPSIKKTEWTREEDEKLLHLAKLMPTQWRTIAPIVGRTPSQCLERYEKLLDAACTKDENYEPADDPRKLRPGEIDPNPEAKPARPDPVDMDEDEKEMLSEARARLANTRGKKAKRKAREKQLEEARRLASLQKRRELKAAGIEGKQRRRKRKGIDYNAEIPFEKMPPPGFYDVVDEERPPEQPQFPTTIEEIEGKRRADVEAQLRKQDMARNKILQRHDAPSAVMQANKLNDPEAVRKRSKLMLPSPQISDRELEEIAKMGYASDLALGDDEIAGGSGAARALLGNYGQTPKHPGMTPSRTPQRTPGGKGDAVMMEAENQARLRQSQTPLLGGDNPDLHPSDFSGVTPRKKDVQTPNPIATPLSTPGPGGFTPRIGMTPSRELSVTPRGTPIRDDLHINEGMETPDRVKSESRYQAEIRKSLQANWNALPAPQNEYQIMAPELPKEEDEVEDQIEEDMSDRIARQKAQEEARQAALLRKRSKVLQRELPRPPQTAVDVLKDALIRVENDAGSFIPSFLEQSDELIKKELVSLLEHDNAKYPIEEDAIKEKKKGSKNTANGRLKVSVPEIDDFEEEEITEASKLIEEEVSILRVGMGHENASLDEFVDVRDACLDDMMYFPGKNSYGQSSVASVGEKIAALQNDFEIVKSHMEGETRKALRLENKLKVLTKGYDDRAGKLWLQIEASFKEAGETYTELECFRALHTQEQLAASNRIEELWEAVNQQKGLEKKLQFQYSKLMEEQERVEKLLAEEKERINQRRIAEQQRFLAEEKERIFQQQIAEQERLLAEEKERVLQQQIAEQERLLAEEKESNSQQEVADENGVAKEDSKMPEDLEARVTNDSSESLLESKDNNMAIEDKKAVLLEEQSTADKDREQETKASESFTKQCGDLHMTDAFEQDAINIRSIPADAQLEAKHDIIPVSLESTNLDVEMEGDADKGSEQSTLAASEDKQSLETNMTSFQEGNAMKGSRDGIKNKSPSECINLEEPKQEEQRQTVSDDTQLHEGKPSSGFPKDEKIDVAMEGSGNDIENKSPSESINLQKSQLEEKTQTVPDSQESIETKEISDTNAQQGHGDVKESGEFEEVRPLEKESSASHIEIPETNDVQA